MGVHLKQGKTNKAFEKRLRITKRGKVLSRKAGKDHFNARSSRASQLNDKSLVEQEIDKKTLGKYLPNK